MSHDLEAELLKALMVTYATALIVAQDMSGNTFYDNEQLKQRIRAVKEALS